MSSGNQGQRYRQAHDPYNGIEEPDIRPDFVARKNLANAEKAATAKTNNSHSSNSLLDGERNQSSNTFRNNVSGRRGANRANSMRSGGGLHSKDIKKKKRFGRAAPASIITMLLAGGGALFFLTQAILGPHLSSLYTRATDVQYTSYNMRNQRLFKYMLNGGDQVKVSLFSKKYTTFTPYMKSRLKKNGIEVGHIDADGNFKNDIISTRKTVLKYNDEIIDANSFQNKFASDANFRDAYYKAKRGRVAGFFDDTADRFYRKKGATRDIFNDYKSTGDDATDTKNFKEVVTERVTGADGTINTANKKVDEETGEEKISKNGEDIDTKNMSGSTPEAKARSMVNRIAGKVSNVGVPVCSALRIANMAAVTVSAYQIYQSIAYFLSLMEPVSKAMAGEGDASGINQALNFLTKEETTDVSYVSEDGTTAAKAVTGSPLQSAGSKLVLADTRSSQESVAPYSIKNVTRAATTIAASTGATNVVCDGVMAASAIMSLASSAIPGGTLAKFIIYAVAQTVGGIAITGVVSLVVSAIIPYVAKIFAQNLFDDYKGVPAGELFSQGAASSNFKLATEGSAYMPASEEYVKRQNQETTLALAEEAEVDRLGRSPFDATSDNTFLGSILKKFAYLPYSSGIFGHISSVFTSIGNSLTAFNPSASAYDSDISYTSTYSSCPNALNNTVCDIYDQEIVAMDYSTIDIEPDDPTYVSVIEPNLDENGNIKKGSNLAKFITVCTERESPWGVLDSNIMSVLQTDFGIVGNNLPFISNVVDIINAAEDIENKGWGTGENCRMSSDNPRWNSELKYYQRYIQDMRILSGMTNEKNSNPVIAYQEQYEAEHPIDTSYTGTLARISGQSKDDIAFLLELSRYSNEIAKYNLSERYAFSENPEETKIVFEEKTDPSLIAKPIYFEQTVIDRRNYLV